MRDCVVELVGLEPTIRVLWNMRVFDQLTWSNNRHSNSRGPLFIDISTNGNLRLPSGREVPGVPRTVGGVIAIYHDPPICSPIGTVGGGPTKRELSAAHS